MANVPRRSWEVLDEFADYVAKMKAKVARKSVEPDCYTGMCAPGTHRWTSRLVSTPDVHEWETWCDVCGCQSDPREGD